jgi:preprotein translocase SecE subunit
MATAVQTSQPQPGSEPRPTNPTTRLLTAGLAGAVYLLVGIAVAGYAVPLLWTQFLAPAFAGNAFVNAFLRIVVQLGVIVGLVVFGSRLAGSDPPKGFRGSVFLWLVALIVGFLIAREIGLLVGVSAGPIVFAVSLVAVAVAAWRLLATPKAVGWMHALEEQGWFHTNNYKRTQGLRVRRYTLVGLLLVGLSGVWAGWHHMTFGSGDKWMRMPFLVEGDDFKAVNVLSDVQYSVPLLIAAAVLWVSWRAVNLPTFADFLVATEAEMNKVSWSPRKRLVQDTVVVLTTTILLTLFLLFVDLFWGWLLSREPIGVLPAHQAKQKVDVTGSQTEW